MTSVRPRLFAAVPLLAVAFVLVPTSAPASLPESCNGLVDVAVGAPKADVAGQADAGSVTLVFESGGSSFSNAADVTISESDLTGTPAAGDLFGASVAVGVEDADPHCSLVAIGAPGANSGAGKVYVFTVDEDGIVPASITVLSQDTDGVASAAEPGDNFGASVYFGGDLFVSWLAVGSPGEDVGTAVDAGMVHVLPYPSWGDGSVSYVQGQGGVPSVPETGDHFGRSLGAGRNVWSLWVGSPEEDLGSLVDAGAITVLPGSYNTDTGAVKLPGTVSGTTAISQDSAGVPGAAEAGDHFGSVLSALPGTQSSDRQPVVGVPYENVGSIKDAGIVMVAYQDKTWGVFQQGQGTSSGRIDSIPEAGDHFGAALAVYDRVLLIGVPGEDVGAAVDAGMIHRMTATGVVPKLSPTREQSVSQSTSGVLGAAETGDRFGAAVAFSVNGAVIGVPGEDIPSGEAQVVGAGALAFLPYKNGAPSDGLTATGNQAFFMGSANFPGAPESGAGFGQIANSLAQ